MLLTTILELSAIPSAFAAWGATAYFMRRKPVPKPHLTEYTPQDHPMLAATQRYEFTDEHGAGTGELVPRDTDPHTAAMDRGIREGKSFGARAVKGTP